MHKKKKRATFNVKVFSVYLIAENTFLARAPGKGFPGHLNVKR